MQVRKYVMLAVVYTVVVAAFLGISWCTSEAVSYMAQEIPLERHHTIVIDAGHGGEDGGATSCSGVLESIINLQIAQQLNDLLHLLGYQTVMVRTDDRSVYTQGNTIAQKKASDLKERVHLVNKTEHALLVSIHQNTFSDGRYHGAQVFYGPKGESRTLAEQLQTAFCQTINPGSNRGIKKADGIYLMQHIDCTGVLIECGFLSNPEEDRLLKTKAYQQKLNCVIAGTLSQFLTDG